MAERAALPRIWWQRGGDGMPIWIADGEKGLMRADSGTCRLAGAPGAALCALDGTLFCAGRDLCLAYDSSGQVLLEAPLPPGVCALAAFGNRICALSSEADSVIVFSGRTGAPLWAAPCGVCPRDLCVSPCGQYLAVAGGAAGEVLLLDTQLRCQAVFRVPGAACAVCFLPRGLAALCAVEDRELSARLFRVTPRGVTEEIFLFPAIPCALCALPDGGCLVGCHGQVTALRADGKVTRGLPCVYPARLRRSPKGPLICDSCGGVYDLSGYCLYRGGEPLDALYLPDGGLS